VSTTEVQTAINFFLTLISIIGTFFYVQLSNWYRELLEVEEKFKLNKHGDEHEDKRARLECRFQLNRLYNHVPALVSALVSVFLVVIGLLALSLGTQLQPGPQILPYYWIAGGVFYAIYLFLTAYFLIKGYRLGWQLKVEIDESL
jgi:hypothetical protein